MRNEEIRSVESDMEEWDRVNEERRLAKERRRFLILAAFDLFFVFLMWLIYTVSKGKEWSKVFQAETDISNPKFFQESLFDVVVTSVMRFVWNMSFYCVCRVNHWLPLSLSTVATTAFLIVKSLFYFVGKRVYIPELLVVLGSFIMAWVQLWMIPSHSNTTLIRTRQPDEPSITRRAELLAGRTTDDDFRSAFDDSSDNSDENAEAPDQRHISRRSFHPNDTSHIQLSDEQYIQIARGAIVQGRKWYSTVGSWQTVSKGPLIKCYKDPTFSKVYFICVECPVSVHILRRIMCDEEESSPSWNKSVLLVKCLYRINLTTSLIYSIAAPALMGYISSRDFVDVRHVESNEETGRFEMVCTSVQSALPLPTLSQCSKKHVRGANGPNFWVIRQSETNENHSVCEWILNTDLKGGLPRNLVDRGTTSFLTQYAHALRQHCSSYVNTV